MNDLSLDKNQRYLLACSFGPDSMALFYMLASQGYSFDCAIVNYHLRKESDSEVDGLLKYASRFHVQVYVLDYKEKIEKNIESKCREIRYSFFESLYKENGYDALLVAHHQDDKLETYFMQKQRQNCPIYYGIKEESVIKEMKVIRPLLSYSKKELMEICLAKKVPYAVDQTNFDTTILRNKIRHEVIGKMSEQERADLLNEIDRENTKLELLIRSIDLNRIHDVNYLRILDDRSLKYSLNVLVKELGENKYLSRENVGEIKKVILSKKPNVFSKIKRGVYLVKEYDYLGFSDCEFIKASYSYVLSKPGQLDTPYFHLDFSYDSSNRNVSNDDYPITIRAALPSDTILIKGNKVSIRRLFIDWKMPLRLRNYWPIILDKNNNPIYIPRYQKDFIPSEEINFYVKH